jgi:hypothetical protein
LIFTDTWAGKFTDLEAVLEMVKPNRFLFNRRFKLPSPSLAWLSSGKSPFSR